MGGNIRDDGGGWWRLWRLSAHITPTAPYQSLPEVLEQHAPPAAPSLHVAPHRRGEVGPRPDEVPPTPQEATLRRLPVPSRAAGLLVIGLERPRRTPVDHAPHIGLVDPHAERRRGHDHTDAIAEERAQHSGADRRGESGVV